MPSVPAFVVLPHRWLVERACAWIGRYRRTSKNDESLTESNKAFIYAAMLLLMLKRLAPCTSQDRLDSAFQTHSGDEITVEPASGPVFCWAAPDVAERPDGEDTFTTHINQCSDCNQINEALVICDEAHALLIEVSH